MQALINFKISAIIKELLHDKINNNADLNEILNTLTWILFLVGRIVCIAQMRSIAADVARSVCLCVGHMGKPIEMPFKGWLMWVQGTMYQMGSRSPWEMENCDGYPANWKALGVSAAVYAAKGIIETSMTAWQHNCCIRLQCSRLIGVALHCSAWKSAPPPAMRPYVKILWPLGLVLLYIERGQVQVGLPQLCIEGLTSSTDRKWTDFREIGIICVKFRDIFNFPVCSGLYISTTCLYL